MSPGPTYYDVLGLKQSASPEQIRSAYLRLMKRYHPDLTDAADKRRASHFAAQVNRSYDILKDSGKRAAYDAFLRLEAHAFGKDQVRQRPLLTGAKHRRRQRGWSGSSIATAALACVVALTAAAGVLLPRSSIGDAFTTEASAVDVQTRAARNEAPLSYAELRSEIRLAMGAAPDEALARSRRCFEAAREQRSLARTEKCIVFDDAYLDWNQTVQDPTSGSPYFDGPNVRVRHRDALAAVGDSGGYRLESLKHMVLAALLAEIRSRVTEQPRLDERSGDAGRSADVPMGDSVSPFPLTHN
ncbi:curved DNA-binding protein CbpA [Sphingomonas sp. F9_3S_D5_B_2]